MRAVEIVAPHFTDRVAEAQHVVASHEHSLALAEVDRELLSDTLGGLRRAIGDRCAAEQLLHGEPHPGNVFNTRNGLVLFIDLETCCSDPVEFAFAHVPEPEAVSSATRTLTARSSATAEGSCLPWSASWRWDLEDQMSEGRQVGTNSSVPSAKARHGRRLMSRELTGDILTPGRDWRIRSTGRRPPGVRGKCRDGRAVASFQVRDGGRGGLVGQVLLDVVVVLAVALMLGLTVFLVGAMCLRRWWRRQREGLALTLNGLALGAAVSGVRWLWTRPAPDHRWRTLHRARRNLLRASTGAENAVLEARAAGASLGHLEGLTRRLCQSAVDVDRSLRIAQQSGSNEHAGEILRHADELTKAARSIQRTAAISLAELHRLTTDELVGHVQLEEQTFLRGTAAR
jgi:hypothetical protein